MLQSICRMLTWYPLMLLHSALQSFCRKLVWHRECLWPQDLPQHCLLVLEAEDDLVPSKLARTMLHKMKHPCDVRSPPGFCLSVRAGMLSTLSLFDSFAKAL